MNKKVLALLLTLCMMFTLVPGNVMAEEAIDNGQAELSQDLSTEESTDESAEDETVPENEGEEDKDALSVTDVAKIGDVSYPSLDEAFENASKGDTIVLLMDQTFSGQNAADKLSGYVIDLNDKTITLSGNTYLTGETTIKNGNIVVSGYVSDSYLCLYTADTKLTLDDVNLTGTMDCYAVLNAAAGSTLIIKDSTIDVIGDVTNPDAMGNIIYGGNVTVDNSTIKGESTVRGIGFSNITIQNNSTVNISKVETGLNCATVTVDNSNVTITNATKRAVRLNNNTLTLQNGAKLTATDCVEDIIGIGTNDVVSVSSDSTLDAEDKVTPAPAAPTGSNSYAYTKEVDGYVRVWGEGGGNAKESFVLKLYADETLIATTQLNNVGGIIDGDVYVTWNFFYPSSNDEYWTTTWEEGHPNAGAQPTKVELYIDGTLVATTAAKMSGADDVNPVVWAELGGVAPAVPEVIEIYDWDDLKALDARVEGGDMLEGVTVKLMNDIDLYEMGAGGEPVSFNPIGANKAYFKGTFDGQGHTIKNMYQSGWALGYDWYNYGTIGMFAYLWDATVKNVTIENAECFVEGGNVAGIAGCAWGDCTFENITIKNSTYATYNNRAAGIVGYTGGEGTMTFKNILVDEDTVIAGLWGSFDSSLGGVIGSIQASTDFTFEDVTVACRLDAYNDVTAAYKYYAYRMCGMLIGKIPVDANNQPILTNVTIDNNVKIDYSNTPDYAYTNATGSWKRVEAGYAYDGVDLTQYPEAEVIYKPSNAIFGGQQYGSYGQDDHEEIEILGRVAAFDGDYFTSLETAIKADDGATDADSNAIAVKLMADYSDDIVITKSLKLDVNGYSFTGNVTTIDGYEVEFKDGVYTVVKCVAQIGDEYFTSLQAAINAAQTGDTVTLLADTKETEITVVDGKNFTLDLNGKTLFGYFAPFKGNLTVKNGKIKNTDSSKSAIEINAGELTLNDVNIDSARHAVRIDGEVTATIDGGTYRSAIGEGTGTYHAINVSGNANVTIENGTFVGPKGTTADSGAAVNVQTDAAVTIQGGNFSGGKRNTLSASGTLAITGGTFDQDPSAYVADGYRAVKSGDNWTVKEIIVLSGSGTKTDPYLITNLKELKAFRDYVNEGNTYADKYVKLTADIYLTGEVWTPIGTSNYDKTPTTEGVKMFAGNFDGGNHTITGLTSDGYVPDSAETGSTEYSFGLFGYVYGANISNVKLENVDIDCGTRKDSKGNDRDGSGVAALIGYYFPANEKTSVIYNCHVLSGTVKASNNMGGLIGHMDSQLSQPAVDITIKNCSNAADVTTEAREAGGILGLMNSAREGNYLVTMRGTVTFKNCVNTGDITSLGGGAPSAGGILGRDHNQAAGQRLKIVFDGCENSGTITVTANGETHAAGIGAGFYSTGAWLIAKDCTNTGNVVVNNPSSKVYAGGLISYGGVVELINSTSTGTVTGGIGNTYVGGAQNILFLEKMDNFTDTVTGYTYYLNGGTSPEYAALVDDASGGGNFHLVETAYKDGFVFGGWYDNAELTGDAYTALNKNVKTYYAKWIGPVAKIGDTTYDTLQSAIDAVQAGEKITLIADVTENITIADDANVVIDLGGKTLTGCFKPFKGNLTVYGGTIDNNNGDYSAIEITAGTLDIKDVNITSTRHGVRIDGVVTATIDGGIYKVDATSGTRHAVNVSGAANVTIKNGTFIGPKGTTMDSGAAVMVQSGATVTIEGGNFSGGKNHTLSSQGTLTVNGGTVNDGMTIVKAGTISVTGGTFNGGFEKGKDATGTFTFTGGTFDQDPTAYVADDYKAVESNGTWTVREVAYVAEVNGNKYESIQEAVNAAADGATITVIADHELVWDGTTNVDKLPVIVAVDGSKNVTIDLNGKKLTGTSGDKNLALYAAFAVDNGGSLILKDSVGTGSVSITGKYTMYCLLMGYEAGTKLTVEGGTYYLENAHDSLIYSGSASDIVTVTGGNFTLSNVGDGQNGKPWIFNVYGSNDFNATVTGGTYNADIFNQYWRHEVQCRGKYAARNNGNGTWTVVPAAAYVTETVSDYRYNMGYETISEALAAAQDGEEVFIFAGNYNQNLNINKDITVVGETTDTGYQLVEIIGKLNITADGATVKGLYVYNDGANAAYINAKDVLIEGCEIASGKSAFRSCYTDGTVTFKDSVIAGSVYGIHFDGSAGGNIVIENCKIQGWTSFASTINKVTISDTEFAEGNENQLRFYQDAELTNVKFNPNMTVDFGKNEVNADFTNCSVTDGSALTEVIYLPDIANMGVKVKVNGDPVVVEAMIGEEAYLKLADAIAAAQDGETVKLFADISTSKTIGINKAITLDGNGKTLTYTGTDRAFQITGGTVVINDLTVNMSNAPEGSRGINLYNGSTNEAIDVTLNNVTVNGGKAYAVNIGGGKDNKLTINNSNLTGYAAINVNAASDNHTIVVDGSALNGKNHNNNYHFGAVVVDGTNAHSLTITNSTVTTENLEGVTNTYYQVLVGANCTYNVCEGIKVAVRNVYNNTDGLYYVGLADAVDCAKDGDTIVLLGGEAISETIKVDKNITLDLNGKTITGTDNATKSFALIEVQPGKELTINDTVGTGKITLTATNDRDFNNYSSVISNQRGKLTVNGGTIEHLGGTDMAYGIDNLTNGKGTYAETVINGGTIKSTYRGIRQFLNGVEAQNILTVNGGTIEGTNKSIWTQQANKYANPGSLTVKAEASLFGDVLLSAEAAATEYPVTLSVAAAALKDGATVVKGSAGLPAGYILENANGTWNVREANYIVKIGEVGYESLADAIANATAGDTIVFLADIKEDVTVKKSLTIDGAGKKYTGNISVNGSTVSVTVKNVNFVNGTGYAITTNTIKSITVENCTVKNYGYGFLYANKTSPTVVVKDVTVNDCNYGFHWVYGSTATLEDVTMTNVKYGLYVQNYASNTINVKNCDISSIAIWERSGSSGVQTFKFEGTNTVSELSESQYAKYVLTATDATLTAPEGNNVTTSVADHLVKYDNGTYKVVKAAAKIGDKMFETFTEAYDAASAGETITLLAPIVVAAGETLTLNKDVTIEYTSNVPGEDMITNKGNLVIDGATLVYTNTDTTANNVTVSTISCEPGSTLEVKSGTVKNDSANNSTSGIYVYAIDLVTNGNLGEVTATISGGEVISTNYMAIRQFVNGEACKNTLTVTGGTISGKTRGINIQLKNNMAYTTISGGKISGEDYSICFLTTSENVSVTGGEFEGAVWYSGTEGFISGGTFDAEPDAAYAEEGYLFKQNADDTYTAVVDPAYGKVATITNADGTTAYYATVSEALLAAPSNATVTLLTDTKEETGYIMIKPKVTLDLAGYRLEADYVVGLNGSNVIDSSADNTGLLKTGKDNVSLDLNNAQLPVWNGTDGYVFLEIELGAGLTKYTANDSAEFKFQIRKTINGQSSTDWEKLCTLLLDNGAGDHGLSMMVEISWTNDNAKVTQRYLYNEVFNISNAEEHLDSDNLLGTYYATLNGISSRTEITYFGVIVSGTGAEISSDTKK